MGGGGLVPDGSLWAVSAMSKAVFEFTDEEVLRLLVGKLITDCLAPNGDYTANITAQATGPKSFVLIVKLESEPNPAAKRL